MRRTILLAGVLPFVSAFLGGFLAFSLAAPSAATAQSDVMRGSVFELVGSDGTVIARLAAGAGGGGELTLNRPDGVRRTTLNAGPGLTTWTENGTTVGLRVGIAPADFAGDQPFNGVQLGPGGAISTMR
jgi:hypothetical protein